MKNIVQYITEAINSKHVLTIAKRIFGDENVNDDTLGTLANFSENVISKGKSTYNFSNKKDRESFYNLFDKKILNKYNITVDGLANRVSPIRSLFYAWLNTGSITGKGITFIDKQADLVEKRLKDFETKRSEAVNKIESIFNIEEGTNKVDDLKKYDENSKDIIVCRSILYPEIPCLFYIQKEDDLKENGKVKISELKDDIDYYYLDFLYNRYSKKELRYMFADTKYGFGYASRWYPVSCYYNHFVKNPNPTEKEFNNE